MDGTYKALFIKSGYDNCPTCKGIKHVKAKQCYECLEKSRAHYRLRNLKIVQKYKKGASLKDLAKEYNLSPPRVKQIIVQTERKGKRSERKSFVS